MPGHTSGIHRTGSVVGPRSVHGAVAAQMTNVAPVQLGSREPSYRPIWDFTKKDRETCHPPVTYLQPEPMSRRAWGDSGRMTTERSACIRSLFRGNVAVTAIDTQRLKQLIDDHGAALNLYARQWCHAPEDALQEALIELCRQDPAPDQPVAWMYKTVRRRAMNVNRAEQRRTRHHHEAGLQRQSWFLDREDQQPESHELEQMLAGLPQLEREIVVARVWGELSFEQIAELVERSCSSVHRRYRRALALLGRRMNGQLDRLS